VDHAGQGLTETCEGGAQEVWGARGLAYTQGAVHDVNSGTQREAQLTALGLGIEYSVAAACRRRSGGTGGQCEGKGGDHGGGAKGCIKEEG